MKKTGLIGWRGMVGSVLMDRMLAEGDFDHIEAHFFSTSQVGEPTPDICENRNDTLKDARSIDDLKPMDVIKAMIEQFGEDACDKKTCKKAIRELIDSGRCIYSYVGGSYITLPEGGGSAG